MTNITLVGAQSAPPSVYVLNSNKFIGLNYIDILTWDEYLRDSKQDSLLFLSDHEIKKELKKNTYTPIRLASIDSIHAFCEAETKFINHCKNKGSTDDPNCSVNEVYKKLKQDDPEDKFIINYSIPTIEDYLLLIKLLKSNKKLKKAFMFSDTPELLKDGRFILISPKNLEVVILNKCKKFTFRFFVAYLPKK